MPADSTAERRLTPAERQHEVVMALAQRAASPPEHTVEVARNAKGVAQFTITVRGYNAFDVWTEALSLYQQTCRDLPYPETEVA